MEVESIIDHRPKNIDAVSECSRDRIGVSSDENIGKSTRRVHMASYSSNNHHRPSEEEEIGPAFIAGALDSKINNILETTSAVERQSVVAFSRRASN